MRAHNYHKSAAEKIRTHMSLYGLLVKAQLNPAGFFHCIMKYLNASGGVLLTDRFLAYGDSYKCIIFLPELAPLHVTCRVAGVLSATGKMHRYRVSIEDIEAEDIERLRVFFRLNEDALAGEDALVKVCA